MHDSNWRRDVTNADHEPAPRGKGTFLLRTVISQVGCSRLTSQQS